MYNPFSLTAVMRRLRVRTNAQFQVVSVLAVFGIRAVGAEQTFYVNTVSYSVNGILTSSDAHPPGANFTGNDFLQSTIGEPVIFSGDIANTIGEGDALTSGSVTVFASAETGSLHVGLAGTLSQSSSQAHQLGTAQLVNASVQARWQDTFIMGNNVNPLPGRLVQIEAVLHLDGAFGIEVFGDPYYGKIRTSFASAQLALLLTAKGSVVNPLPPAPYGGNFGEASKSTIPTVAPVSHPPITTIPVNFLAYEGQPATIDFLMEVRASGTARTTDFYLPTTTSAFFDANFKHTLRWGGITRVTDSNTGEPILGWTITSASGVDYANAINPPSVPPIPSIKIQTEGTSILISWPATMEDYHLETTSTLGSGTPWLTITNIPAMIGTNKLVSSSLSSGEKYYRLRK